MSFAGSFGGMQAGPSGTVQSNAAGSPSYSNNTKASSSKKDASRAAKASDTTDLQAEEDKKKRSSKACDPCRKAKCKCTRPQNEDGPEDGPCQNCKMNGIECTFLGASKKRGPPKGYIEAIENRMHRMEALLGGLLNNDDPRAQALLEEVVGDIEARELLSRDLATAVAVGRDNAPATKSWQRSSQIPKREDSVAPSTSSSRKGNGSKAPITQRGFDLSKVLSGIAGEAGSPSVGSFNTGSSGSGSPFANLQTLPQMVTSWIPEEDLASTTSRSFPNNMGLDSSMEYESVPASAGFSSGSYMSNHPNGMPGSSTTNPGMSGTSYPTSPRQNQRRKLDQPADSASIGARTGRNVSPTAEKRGTANLFSPLQRAGMNVPAPDTINHTGKAYYHLSSNPNNRLATSPGGVTVGRAAEDRSGSVDGMSPTGDFGTLAEAEGNAAHNGPLSELADVVGQLSLDENREVRYHGRSSGLYLISKSARYQDFFWRFPKAGVWPPAEDDSNMVKTEDELVSNTNASQVMPDKRTADHLMELYWIYVHPHLPLLYRSLFVRQYRNTVHGPDHQEGANGPAMANGGKVPTALLLAVYAVAARYSDTGGPRKEGVYWKAGEAYAKKSKELLHEDFGSSRLTSCQALLLLAYREIGCGAMAKSWTCVGMAIRMAQDLGLFRDVDKWFLPINAFGYEEKQTRKRVWWSCVVMDRYVSAYIGRPMAIFERDYDVALPAEDEPDEHDIWRPIRPDGTDWSTACLMKSQDTDPALAAARQYPQGVKSNSLSCFNHSASLSVLFSRIIANLYAIRVRVLGQNSETLLAHLDQALASWFLKLPPHLQYSPAGKKVPPPHVLVLHCQFFAALILLHRPFIPAHGSGNANATFPSHSICTTAAAAISNIVTIYSKTYTLRQAIPFMTYYVFSAGIQHVYNSTYESSLAPTAKAHLTKCMRALQEMEITWPSASRQRELLLGLVDLRDVDIDIETTMNESLGRKRQAENQEVESRAGSGTSTPNANGGIGRNGRAGRSDTLANSFASAQIAQSSQAQPTRRTMSMSATTSRRRQNSVSVGNGRQGGFHPTEDLRSAASAQPSTSFPTSDFTFISISPAAQCMPLPSASQPSPSLTSISGFESFGVSPSPGNYLNSFGQGANGISDTAEGTHISNILGLSGSMNMPYDAPGTSGFPGMNGHEPSSMAGNNAPSGTAFGNFTDFLFDPFWQQMQAQHGMDASNAGPDTNEITMAGQAHGFGDGHSTAYFNPNLPTGTASDDWQSYLQNLPRDS